MHLTEKYLGRAQLLSTATLTAGAPATVHIRYTCGQYGLDENAGIRLAWRSVSDWEMPQFSNPKGFGYTTIATSGQAVMDALLQQYKRPFHNSVVIKARDGALGPGDTIDIILGDRSQGSPGLRTQSFVESAHEIKVLVDPFNTNRYEELPAPVLLRVSAGPANELQLVVPSRVDPGEEFPLTLRILDEWGNPCDTFEGTVDLALPSEMEGHIARQVRIGPEDGGFRRVEGNRLDTPGSCHITAVCGTMNAVSNSCTCEKGDGYRLFWGDMHGQTDFTVGTGSLDEYFRFARDPAALDFTGWQGNDFEINEEKWKAVREKTASYHEPHRFLTFLGYEWSGNHPGGGDHNVFFLEDEEQFYPSSHWSEKDSFSVDSSQDRYPLSRLCDTFRGREDVILTPHIGGRPANLDYHDPELMPVIEIHSHHGTFEWFAHQAMERGLKVGFAASSDDHTCRPGLSYPLQNTGQMAAAFDVKSGLLAVYARELTREAIWEAIKARRCYAVTYGRMDLDVRVNGARMGDEIHCAHPPEIQAQVRGTGPIDRMEVYRGTKLIHTSKEAVQVDGGTRRIKVMWSGVRTTGRSKSTCWDGSIHLDQGKICAVEERAFDTFQQGITERSRQVVYWKSSTSGDLDGLVLELDAPDEAVLHFHSPVVQFSAPLVEIGELPKVYQGGGVNLKVEVSLAGPGPGDGVGWTHSLCHRDEDAGTGEHAYWIKVIQEDGQMAFSSPVFVGRS